MSTCDDRIISAIYETATDESAWSRLMSLLTEELNALGAAYLIFDLESRQPVFWSNFGHEASTQRLYVQRYADIDPTLELAVRSKVGVVLHSCDHFSKRYVDNSEYFQDFLIPSRIGNVVGAKVIDNGGFIGVFSAQQAIGVNSSSEEQRRFLDRITPHVTRAAAIHLKMRTLNFQKKTLEYGLDALPQAAILVTNSKQVSHMNLAAETLISSRCGVSVVEGILRCTNAECDADLAAAVANATCPSRSKSTFVNASCGGKQLFLSVLPVSETCEMANQDRRHALIMSAAPLPSREVFFALIGDIFGLTNAEKVLAYHLLAGGNLSEVAADLRLSRETLRTQLRSVFAKTETNRQGQLLSLLRQMSTCMPVPTGLAPMPMQASGKNLMVADS